MSTARLRVFLDGRFRVESRDGADLTPRGAKDCGLIALLLTSQHGERSRTWLQSKLWSDRGPEQAAGSLRQSVTKVRKAFGDVQEVLYSNRQCVGIDLDAVEVVRAPEAEFLEGIDVRDQEFEAWLTAQRMHAPAVSLPPQPMPAQGAVPRCVVLRAGGQTGRPGAAGWMSQIVFDMIARALAETFDVTILQPGGAPSPGPAWRIDIDCAMHAGDGFVVRLAMMDDVTGRHLWSAHRAFSKLGAQIIEHEGVIALVQELCQSYGETLLAELPEAELLARPDALCCLGVQRLFSMEAREIDAADTLFAQAHALRPRGLYLAWRAHVREIQLVERVNADVGALKDESEMLLRRAFEMEPNNSMVLALLAINRLHFVGDVQVALQYARRAVHANYGNAMAWWALSAGHLKLDDPAKSYGCARMAVSLALGTPLEFWTQSQLSGAAMAVRKLSEAQSLLQNVSFARPDFRPPLRYLLALHATNEEWADARAAAERLKVLEPGFSIDQLANDRDYPVSLLHRPYGLKRDRILALL
ncbi:MAG: hypothetical protein AAGF60_07825 [Pseudomonadota bacterium]